MITESILKEMINKYEHKIERLEKRIVDYKLLQKQSTLTIFGEKQLSYCEGKVSAYELSIDNLQYIINEDNKS